MQRKKNTLPNTCRKRIRHTIRKTRSYGAEGEDISTIETFTAMLRELGKAFANEGRPGGDEAAKAISDVLLQELRLPAPHNLGITQICVETLKKQADPIAETVRHALPVIRWQHSGLDDGRIRPEIARAMATAELIGPDGMIAHPTVRVGLFLQTAGLDYVTRSHAAEETFIMLAGSGLWACDGADATLKYAGAVIHHPSYAPHSTVTLDEPLIAAWRWNGDINWDTYELKG